MAENWRSHGVRAQAAPKPTRIRHYLLTCGAEARNTEILPIGTRVLCQVHVTDGGHAQHVGLVTKRLRKITYAA
jgi:hypothetical protein